MPIRPFQFVSGMSAPTFARAIGPLVGRIDSLCIAAGHQVDASSAAAFRIAFGVLAFVAVCRFFLNGWIDALYVSPAHHMKYMWFEWVHPPWSHSTSTLGSYSCPLVCFSVADDCLHLDLLQTRLARTRA